MSGDSNSFQTPRWTAAPTASSVVPPSGWSLRRRICVTCSTMAVVVAVASGSLAVYWYLSSGAGDHGTRFKVGHRAFERLTVSPPPALPRHAPNRATCVGEDCHQLARYISESLQETDPCDNFYEYVCANWSSGYHFQGEAVYSEAVMSIHELENQMSSLLQAGTQDTGSRAIFDLYNACVNLSTAGGDALRFLQLLDHVGLAGFPYASSGGRASLPAGRLLRITGVAPLLEISAIEKGIRLKRPHTLFPLFTYVPNAHRAWYRDAAERVARVPMPELFSFEQELVAIFSAPPEPYQTVVLKNLVSTEEWDWAEFLTNALFEIRTVTPETRVRLQPDRLGSALLRLLSTTKPSLVLNYLAFRLAFAYAPLFPSKRFHALSDATVAYQAGWEEGGSERRSHTCTKIAARADPAMAAFLVVSQFRYDHLEAALRNVVEQCKREVLDFLGEMAWVTSSVLRIVEGHFRNLETVFFMTGDWTKGSFRIEQCRPFGCASAGRSAADVFQKMVAQRQRRRLQAFKRRPFPEFPDDFFETEICVVDEKYLTLPVGIVRGVFHKEAFWEYHLSRMVLQLSAVLIDVFRDVVAVHAERYKDLHGRFFAAEQCLRGSQTAMREATSVPFTSNGTAREDLRDMLAVAAAFRVHRKFSSSQSSLQGLPGLPFNAEQLFFVHIALNRCEKYDATYEDQLLRHGRRAHAAYRVNGPLRQSIAFANAFNCRRGAYMNPRRKCVF